MALARMTEIGSSTPLTYGEGDFIGVEASATTSTDHTGFNEAAAFTYEFHTDLQNEHYTNGVHNSLRLARGVLAATWDGTNYVVGAKSYVQTTAGVVTRGGGFSINRLGAGDLTITLTNAVTAGPTMVVDLTTMYEDSSNAHYRVRVFRHTYTSTTVFNIRRYAGTTIAAMALADGPFHIMIHS
jgi:hypothetical protein